MMRQYLKAILWPRKPITGGGGEKNYRYVIVGMLVTNKPIEDLKDVTEIVADGEVAGLVSILQDVFKREPRYKPGDASDVLLSLEDL